LAQLLKLAAGEAHDSEGAPAGRRHQQVVRAVAVHVQDRGQPERSRADRVVGEAVGLSLHYAASKRMIVVACQRESSFKVRPIG
jgi:hypothetical protein